MSYMKKTLLYIVTSIVLISCQKEKFDLGIYELTMIWSDTVDGEKKNFESTRDLAIVNETPTTIEVVDAIVYNGNIVNGFPLLKDGNKISGDLPVSSDITEIDGHKNFLTNTIKGTFKTTKYVTQGQSGAPVLKYEYSGKFKMKKI